MLKIEKKFEDEKLFITLEGRLDTNTADELVTELDESLEGVKELCMDFEKLEYISSAGLRVLLATHKKLSELGGMKIKNVCSDIMDVFEITGFNEILEIEK